MYKVVPGKAGCKAWDWGLLTETVCYTQDEVYNISTVQRMCYKSSTFVCVRSGNPLLSYINPIKWNAVMAQ